MMVLLQELHDIVHDMQLHGKWRYHPVSVMSIPSVMR